MTGRTARAATAAATRAGSCTPSGPTEYEFWQASNDRQHVRHRLRPERHTRWARMSRHDSSRTGYPASPRSTRPPATVAADVAKLTDGDVKAPSALPGLEPRPRPGAPHRNLQRDGPAAGVRSPRRDGGTVRRRHGRPGQGRSAWRPATTPPPTRADLAEALERVLRAFDALPGIKDSSANRTGWWAPISYRGGVVLDGGLALWRELVIHDSDLLDRAGAGNLEPERSASDLFDFLAARVPPGEKLVLQPLGLPPVSPGSGNRSTVVNGMLTDSPPGWPAANPPRGASACPPAADGMDLPELLPWPAATPATK